jgi:hypothetical protein
MLFCDNLLKINMLLVQKMFITLVFDKQILHLIH